MELNIPAAVEGGDFGDLGSTFDGFLYTDVDEFRKALTSGYGTDAASYTQGRALQFESLEPSLIATIQERGKHFPLFDKLEKGNATSVVDQYTTKDAIGGFPGGATNTETGTISEQTGTYARKTRNVKYLMTMRTVSAVQRATDAQVEAMAIENEDAILELLSTAEWLFFNGDSSIVATEFDGIEKELTDNATSDHILDLRGQSVTAEAAEIVDSAAFVASFENFGSITDAWTSKLVGADFDKKLDPAHRVAIDGKAQSIQLGTPVRGITTADGDIALNRDVFIQEGQMPFVGRGGKYATNAASGNTAAPQSAAGVAAVNASSQFVAATAGLYYYAVEGVNRLGRSTLVKSAQVAVAAGESVTLTITESVAGTETGYVIHRCTKNGSNGNTDFREMCRVAKTGGGTTVYVDHNQNIPGTSKIYLLNMERGARAINLRRLLPLTRFNLFPTNTATYPWAQLLFLYLRVAKPKQHRIVKNVLPSGALWTP